MIAIRDLSETEGLPNVRSGPAIASPVAKAEPKTRRRGHQRAEDAVMQPGIEGKLLIMRKSQRCARR